MVVAAPHREAEYAGAAVLAEGGNAVEAAIAVAAALTVAYPAMTGLGGDGFWLICEPGKTPVAIQACGPAAAAADPRWYRERGHTSVPTRGPGAALTVPGAVSGWARALELSRRWGGSFSLERLFADARRLALQGVAVTRSQAALTKAKADELLSQPGFATAFAPRGVPAEGAVQVQPRLASVYARLAKGLDDFYRGDLARSMAGDLAELGSPLSLSDLNAYQARFVEPLSVELSVGTVWNLPPPTQGVSSLAILAMFDRLGVTEPEGFAHVHALVEATKAAFAWRNTHVTDPARMSADVGAFLSSKNLDRLAASIDRKNAAPWPPIAAPGDTVWFGVIDAQGRAVSVIQSLYWEFGAGIVLPETGLLWQNRGSSFSLDPGPMLLEPGRLPFHTLNPALAKLKDGRTVAYGTMGGEGQPQTQAAFVTRYAWFGQPLKDAIAAPRWLLGRTWGEDTTKLRLENRFDPTLANDLKAAGHAVEVVGAWDDRMGHAGALVLHPDGSTEATHDPRADGAGLKVDETASWRLQKFLRELAQIGAESDGGVTRRLYDEAWVQARAWLSDQFASMGLEVRSDRVGNLYGRIEGRSSIDQQKTLSKRSEDGFRQAKAEAKTGAYPQVREDLSEVLAQPEPAAVVLTGSHFDTVRHGGWYDGAYGVAASAVAVAELLRRHGPPRRTVEVVAFAEEEGSRFPLAYWGSGSLADRWKGQEASILDSTDEAAVSLGSAQTAAGFGKPDQASPVRTDLAAYLEVHIEQGIVLERSGHRVGVVTAIVGQRRWLVRVTGAANHAGTTPMGLRQDAFAGAVEMAAALEAAARLRGDPLVATVGFVEVTPNTPNVIPGEVAFSVDARHTDDTKLAAFCAEMETSFRAIAERRELGVAFEPRLNVSAVAMDAGLRAALHGSAQVQGLSALDLPSGAGHDAQVIAALCPSAMLFIPSRHGVSHSPLESSSPQALADGLAVLTDALYELAWKGSPQ